MTRKDRSFELIPPKSSLLAYCYLSWPTEIQNQHWEFWEWCEYISKRDGIRGIINKANSIQKTGRLYRKQK